MNEIEIRSASGVTMDAESRKLEGYAILFDTVSDGISQFTEEIRSSAVTQEVIEKSDIKCYLNHDEKRGILARSKYGKGSLGLTIDEKGLKFSFDVPNSPLGDEVFEGVKRGDYDSCSFAFRCAQGGDKWEKRSGKLHRIITKFDALSDVSIVADAAYSDTTVAVRSAEEFDKEERELEQYYGELKSRLK